MKLKKFFAGFLAATMLIGTMGVTALAAPTTTGPAIQEYTEYAETDPHPAVVLTKNVVTDPGTEVPELTYVFKVVQNKTGTIEDGGTGQPHTVDTADFFLTEDNKTELILNVTPKDLLGSSSVDYDASKDQYKLESASILEKATVPGDPVEKIPEYGPNGPTGKNIAIYRFDVTELRQLPNNASVWGGTQDTAADYIWRNPATPTTVSGEVNDTLTMSRASYEMYIYTKDRTAPATGRYIFAITVKQTTMDNGEAGDGAKINPTPGGNPAYTGDFSEMEFKNNFEKKVVHDPLDPNNQPYQISKKVAGVNNDAAILSGDSRPSFKFNVTVEKEADDERTELVGRLWTSENGSDWVPVEGNDTNGVDITVDDNGDSITDPNKIWNNEAGRITHQKVVRFEFNNSSDPNVATGEVFLAHNQKITFPEAPAGMKFIVVEDDYYSDGKEIEGTPVDGQTPKYKMYPSYNGAANTLNYETATDTEKLAARTDIKTVVSTTPHASSDCVNDGKYGTTPAGIITQYLPFFVIIALAVIALIGVVIVKGRRRGMAY